MSEPELAYMTGTNDDFDLPRWQTQTHHDSLSSSVQTAHVPSQPSYLYPGVPPPPPPPPPALAAGHRLPPIPQSTTGSSRQPRISQLLDQDQQLGISASPYQSTAQNQISRSASLSGAANTTVTSRGRRHHQPDDLEGAFNSDIQSPRQQPHTGASSNSFYPSSVGYHTQSLAGTTPAVNNSSSPASDSYSDMYYSGPGGHPPKRSQTTLDASSSRSGPSPLRTANPNTTLMTPYSQQAQYSPTTSTFPYSSSSDQRTQSTASYNPHSRAPSIVTMDSMSRTPPVPSPYSPHSGMHSPYYPMETTSPQPGPQSHTHLTPHPPNRQPSASTPSTPLSYIHPQNSNYFPQDQVMVVEAPKRRASGLRRVRDSRDLRPRVDNHPSGRRMDSSGVYLSVRVTCCSMMAAYVCYSRSGYSRPTSWKRTTSVIPSSDTSPRIILGGC
jgi:dual specificity protein kinase YAK1